MFINPEEDKKDPVTLFPKMLPIPCHHRKRNEYCDDTYNRLNCMYREADGYCICCYQNDEYRRLKINEKRKQGG